MSADDELYAYARLVAGDVARRWAGMDVDDITQEICVYVLGNEKVHAEWQSFCEGDYSDPDQERHAANRMRLICRRAGTRYCRREVAAAVGYRVEDEAFYSVKQLGELVEVYYREGITDQPLRGRADSATAGLVHSESYLTSLLDVERGLKLIKARYRNRLKFRFKDMGQYSAAEIAAMAGNLATAKGKRERIERLLGTTENTIRGRVRQALMKVQTALGGPNPYGQDFDLAA